MKRTIALCAVLVTGIATMSGAAGEPPVPETDFAGLDLTPEPCTRPVPGSDPADPDPETYVPPEYEGICTRLKFAYGPIIVQPGDNDTGLSFQTIEKPWYDGYMVGIAPNLVTADGSVPLIEEIHLHHATWLSSPSYGNGPFFAAGEEKTIARFPVGYGMPVQASDVWYFVHMIHNESTTPEAVWVTYHVDYIAAEDAAEIEFDQYDQTWTGVRAIKPFWLDVWKNGRRANYPVYNTQRGYGTPIEDPVTLDIIEDPSTGQPFSTTECTWPRDACSDFDSWGEADVGQGGPGNGRGTDILATEAMSGVLVGTGGHLHPGGTRVEVDVVRCKAGSTRPAGVISSWGGLACNDANGDGAWGPEDEDVRRIFTSDALYFREDPAGDPVVPIPTSWNFSMTVAGIPRWKVNLRAGDFLRINSSYETTLGSWYEGMGIAVMYVHPVPDEEMYGLDPFAAQISNDPVEGSDGCWSRLAAEPDLLCTRGIVTHGPLPEAANAGGSGIGDWAGGLPDGPPITDVAIGAFAYAPGDLGTVAGTGVPTVAADQPVRFWNLDAASNVFHTVTSCAYPCNGSTGIAYPFPDHGFGRDAPMAPGGAPVAFDSSELGFSADFGPAKGQIPTTGGNYPDDPVAWASGALLFEMVPADYGLEPGEIVTYFCRVHPFMRGAFKVV
jgi:hypothetical protein